MAKRTACESCFDSARPKKADSRFMLYYFLSREWRKVVEGFVKTGATVDRVPLEKLPDFPVWFPKLSIQKSKWRTYPRTRW